MSGGRRRRACVVCVGLLCCVRLLCHAASRDEAAIVRAHTHEGVPAQWLDPERQAECAGWLDGTRDTYKDPVYANAVSGGFTSQNRQDSLMWRHVFSRLGRRGVYLDVAANHFKRVSNTFFYDICAHWRGVCVEPNPVYHEGLRAERTCDLIPSCASDSTQTIDIALPPNPVHGLLGGVNGGLTASRVHATRKKFNITMTTAAERNLVSMRCVVLGEELARRRLAHVDLLSLDVEGHEAAVLDGLDLNATRIDYVLCEATRVCAAKLAPHGYTRLQLPDWPVKGDTLWRHPSVGSQLVGEQASRGTMHGDRSLPASSSNRASELSKSSNVAKEREVSCVPEFNGCDPSSGPTCCAGLRCTAKSIYHECLRSEPAEEARMRSWAS